ncbi:hypothetical protein K7432_007432 [Basidiobolus ranarum]|uniref:Uncharacterized protein n=1 Tax=Basidiobolus ranarum TaxID=34480 RepID=A0ABR2W037_9FUNG
MDTRDNFVRSSQQSELDVTLPRAHHATTSPYTFAQFLGNTMSSVVNTLYYNYTMVFFDPINFFITIGVFTSLIVLMSIVTVIMDILSRAEIINFISEHYGHNLSPINWGNPGMFDEGVTYFKDASKYLSHVSSEDVFYNDNYNCKEKIMIQLKVFNTPISMG